MPEPYTSGGGDLGSKALDSLLLYNHLRPAEDSPSEVHSNHASVAPVVAPSAHKMPSVPSLPPRFNNSNKVNSAATNNPGLFLKDTFGVITHVHLDGRPTSTSKPTSASRHTSANRTMAYLPPNGQYNMPIKRPSSTERRPLNQTPRKITILR